MATPGEMAEIGPGGQEPGEMRSGAMKRLAFFIAFAVAAAIALFFTPVGEFFSVDRVKSVAEAMGVFGPVAILLFGLLSPLLFLPRWPIALASGLLYGVGWGTLLGAVASTAGASLHFLLAGSLLAPAANEALRKFGVSREILSRRGMFLVLLFMRAFPLSSFAAMNLLAGAVKMRHRDYLAATFLGLLPLSLVYAAWGVAMKKPSAWFQWALALSLLIVVGGGIVGWKYFMPWLKGAKESRDEPTDAER